MSELKNEVRKICEARIKQGVPLSGREYDFILHIKHLQDCIEIVMPIFSMAHQELFKGVIDRGVKLIERS